MPDPSSLISAVVLSAALVVGCGSRGDPGASTGPTCAPRYGTEWGAALRGSPSAPRVVATDADGHVAYGAFGSSGDNEVVSRDPRGVILWRSPVGAIALAASGDGGFYAAASTANQGLGGIAATVTRLDANGVVAWSRTLSWSANIWAGAFVAMEPTGGVWVLGSERQVLREPQPPTLERPFIARLDANGDVVTQQTLAKVGVDVEPRGLALDAEGRVLVALRVNQGALSVGNTQYDVNGGAVVAAFNPDGGPSWSRSVSESSNDNLRTLARGNDGTVYAAGETVHDTLGSVTTVDVFVTALTPSGEVLWRRSFSEGGSADSPFLAARPCGGVVLAAEASVDGKAAILLLDLDAAGNEQRRRLIVAGCSSAGDCGCSSSTDSPCTILPGAVAAHGSDGLILAGAVTGSFTFDGVQLTGTQTEDPFLARFAD